jgi:hypothetical protein
VFSQIYPFSHIDVPHSDTRKIDEVGTVPYRKTGLNVDHTHFDRRRRKGAPPDCPQGVGIGPRSPPLSVKMEEIEADGMLRAFDVTLLNAST